MRRITDWAGYVARIHLHGDGSDCLTTQLTWPTFALETRVRRGNDSEETRWVINLLDSW
jgi:hypothetical protein